jgi:hypothetical protein
MDCLKIISSCIFFASAITLLDGLSISSQKESLVQIGLISAVEGVPRVTRAKGGTTVNRLQTGDSIKTGEKDRVEIELNPGSFLRIGPFCNFEVGGTELKKMTFKVMGGSVVVEAASFDLQIHNLEIQTSVGNFQITKKGVYRFDGKDEGVKVSLIKGGMVWNKKSGDLETLKDDGYYLLTADASASSNYRKLNKKEQDEFESWSQQRSKQLTKEGRLGGKYDENGRVLSMPDTRMQDKSGNTGVTNVKTGR